MPCMADVQGGEMAPEGFSGGLERRKFVRIEELLPARMRLAKKSDKEIPLDQSVWRNCSILNISFGGMCLLIKNEGIKTSDLISGNREVFEFEITLPVNKVVTVRGDIYYIKAFGEVIWNNIRKDALELGVRFSHITPEDEKIISDFIVERYIEKYGAVKKV